MDVGLSRIQWCPQDQTVQAAQQKKMVRRDKYKGFLNVPHADI